MKTSVRRAVVVISLLLQGPWVLGAPPGPLPQGGGEKGGWQSARRLADADLQRRVEELLDVINSGDEKRMHGYVSETYGEPMLRGMSVEQSAAFLLGVSESGGLELHGFRTHPTRLPDGFAVAVVRSPGQDTWKSLQVLFDPAADHKLTSLMIVASPPPEDLVELAALDTAGVVAELEAFVDELAGEGAFSGSVLLARHGKILFRKAYGLASRRYEVPNRIDTRFNLGSMNKMFTAVALAQLVEQGKLSFDDAIGKHVPDGWLSPGVGEAVTVAHLLTHTSGLGDYLEGRLDDAALKYVEMQDYQELVAAETPAFDPGSKWSYSNTGFLLAGVIVEQVAGTGYYEYIRKNIYAPAGMISTDSFDNRHPVPNLATGYYQDENDEWLNNALYLPPRGTSAGGGFSTVEDLLRFDAALRSGKLVSAGMVAMLTSAKPEVGSTSYGYGFMILGAEPPIAGHGGSYPGVSAQLAMDLGRGWTLAVLCNGHGAQRTYSKTLELWERAD